LPGPAFGCALLESATPASSPSPLIPDEVAGQRGATAGALATL